MASQSIVAGSTSVSITVFIQDSSSTTGAGLAGLVFNTSGLIAYYTFDGANAAATAITLATLAAVNSAYSSGGFKEIDSTNMKGGYRLDIPNAALAASKGRAVTIALSGATNMAPNWTKVELTGWDNQDGVRGGMTALPNAAANAAGGLPISAAGALDLDEMNVDIEAIQTSTAGLTFTGAGKVDASVRDWIGGTIPAVNVTGVPLVDLKYTLGTISPAAAGSVGIDWAQVANKGSTVSLTATTIATLTTYTGNTVQTGDSYARIGAPVGASISADIAEIEGETDLIVASTSGLTFTVANQVDVNVVDWKGATAPAMTGDAFARLGAPAGASVSADIAAIKSDTGTILIDVNTGAGAIFTRLGAPAGASMSADIAAVEANAVAIKTQTDKMAFTVTNKIDANVLNINGNATAAANLEENVENCPRGTCSGGTNTTAVVSSMTTPASLTAAGQLVGRTIVFDWDTTTAALQGQASNITNSTTGATPTITFGALTAGTVPANGDTFSIV